MGQRQSTFSLRQRVLTGALAGAAPSTLATRAWELFFGLDWPLLFRVVPPVIGFAILGGWIAAIFSLSAVEEDSETNEVC